jgi:MoaA/NifB/PqqE/SkfB family radical SAM enzyme
MSDNGTRQLLASQPVLTAKGPLKGRLSMVKQAVLEGGPGFCQFAINNACNAGCDFCSFSLDKLPREDWIFAPLPEAKEAIDILVRHGVRYLVITGGEPMLHRQLFDIIRHAKGHGMVVILVTNGSRLDNTNIHALKECGLSSIMISIDAASVKGHEENRRLPKVCEKIRQANALLTQLGIQTTASVTMSRLIDDYTRLPPFLRALGFENVTFSYPLTTLGSSFLGHADSSLVSYTTEELLQVFEEVKKLKRHMHVVNPTASLEEMQRFLRKEPQRFECLGGYKYFYLDWNFLLWRCHYWEKPICSIFDFDDSRRIRDGCTMCMIDCYRDASVMQHVAVSVSDSIAQARQGMWRDAARSLFNRNNLASVRSVFEGLGWINRI